MEPLWKTRENHHLTVNSFSCSVQCCCWATKNAICLVEDAMQCLPSVMQVQKPHCVHPICAHHLMDMFCISSQMEQENATRRWAHEPQWWQKQLAPCCRSMSPSQTHIANSVTMINHYTIVTNSSLALAGRDDGTHVCMPLCGSGLEQQAPSAPEALLSRWSHPHVPTLLIL